MTDIELKILLYLHTSRSQNNIDSVISKHLELPISEVINATSSLYVDGYIYNNSNQNQINLGLTSWRITNIGEIKVSELQSKESSENPIAQSLSNDLIDLDKNYKKLINANLELQNSLLTTQIPHEKRRLIYSIISFFAGAIVTLGGIFLTSWQSETKEPKAQSIKLSVEVPQIKKDTIYIDSSKVLRPRKVIIKTK